MTYEYRCSNCHKEFEEDLTFKEYGEKKVKCPYCHSKKVHRNYKKPVTVNFKGAGFYVNDSKEKK